LLKKFGVLNIFKLSCCIFYKLDETAAVAAEAPDSDRNVNA